LVGAPPHTGSTAQAVLGRIVTGHPDSVAEHRSSVPANVIVAVAKALEKVPADRFRNAQEFANALRDTSYGQEERASPTPSLRRVSTLAAVAGVMTVLAAFGWLRPRHAASTASVSRTSVLLAQEHLLEVTDPAPLAISPDGRLLVYIGEEGGSSQLYVREIAQFGVRAIPNTTGASQPFISPDGESVAFFVDGSLRRTSIEGGIPVELAEVASPGGGSWGENGEILYATGNASLWRVPEDGGESIEVPISVTAAQPPNEVVASQPHWLPGETHALVSVGPSLVVIDVETGRAEPVGGVGPSRKAQYARPGYILFYGGNETVSVVPFDLRQGASTGPARPLVSDALEPAGRQAIFTVSQSGTLAYAKGGVDRRLVAVERSGRETPLDVEPRGYRFPAASPNGAWLAVTVDPAPGQMWMVDLRNGGAQPLTSDGHNLAPGWSPDGSRFAWYRGGVDRPGIHWVAWPGGRKFTFVTDGNRAPLNWPDRGEMFIRTGDWDISVIDVETGEIDEFVATAEKDGYPRVSPNGLWVAYMSAVTGSEEVYVVPRDGSGVPRTVSEGGGTEPRWSPDGTELIWRNGTTIWKADVLAGPEFRITGGPEVLFSGPYDFSNDNNWDLLPDGRFVMVKSDPNVRREIRLVVNLSAELMNTDGN
jgi:serine/threonine-protein kinase